MKPRKVLFWLHLCSGVTAGIVILIMCVTGVLLACEHQILNWGARGYRSAPPSPDARRLSPDLLLAKALESQPGMNAASITILSDPRMPTPVRFGRDLTVYVNPYTGAVLGQGPKQFQSFFASVESWHRWLGAKVDNRSTGRAITGAANLFFAVLVCSGPFLWWPRSWTPSILRNITFFRPGLSGRARDFNWHNTIGLWCVLPLMVVVLSGVVMSFPWANDMLYRLSGSPVPPRPAATSAPTSNSPRPDNRRLRRSESFAADQNNFDNLWARAEQQVPEWQSINMRVPGPSENVAVFTIDTSDGGHPDKRANLTLDLRTADLVRWEPFSSFNRGRQMRSWARFSHTGEAGGIIGETIAVIASLGGAFLVWTGLALALRRLLGWKASRANYSTENSSTEKSDRVQETAADNIS